MKWLLVVFIWNAVQIKNDAVAATLGTVQSARRSLLARRDGTSAGQPWLYNAPPAVVPRVKPLEIPGAPLVLPPVDKLWGIQPSASPPTIAPPENPGETGLQQTVPPQGLEGWYATIPPDAIENGYVDNRTAYYVRCLGGPAPCPYTVPPAIIKYWERVTLPPMGGTFAPMIRPWSNFQPFGAWNPWTRFGPGPAPAPGPGPAAFLASSSKLGKHADADSEHMLAPAPAT
mmetsp:Transcript_14159/g.22537  ORF Transcript_14159/g.22537 Transcript_14159/m.22537 type:complete len:230 (+) Transcript_14159:65-754(+)